LRIPPAFSAPSSPRAVPTSSASSLRILTSNEPFRGHAYLARRFGERPVRLTRVVVGLQAGAHSLESRSTSFVRQLLGVYPRPSRLQDSPKNPEEKKRRRKTPKKTAPKRSQAAGTVGSVTPVKSDGRRQRTVAQGPGRCRRGRPRWAAVGLKLHPPMSGRRCWTRMTFPR